MSWETGWYLEASKETCFYFWLPQLPPFCSYDLVKRNKERKRKEWRGHISILSPLSVIRLQIESLPFFLHLSVNTGSIKPGSARLDPSRQQTFPLFPLTLALLLDWSPGNAHALKIVIIVLSGWITCGGYRCSVNPSLHSLFMWCIRVHWLIFHHRLHPLSYFFCSVGPISLMIGFLGCAAALLMLEKEISCSEIQLLKALKLENYKRSLCPRLPLPGFS